MKKLLFILILFCSIQGFGQVRAFYRLDGNSNDASGNGYNATSTAITYSQGNGVLNGGAGFNGTSGRIITPTITWGTQKITISLFFYPKSTNGGIVFESSTNYAVSTDAFVLYWSGSNFELATRSILGSEYSSFSFGSSLAINKWYYLQCIIDKSIASQKVYMYIDGNYIAGVLNLHNDNSTNRSNANYPIYIGSRAGTSIFLNAAIDEIPIIKNRLSTAQLKDQYAHVKGFFQN